MRVRDQRRRVAVVEPLQLHLADGLHANVHISTLNSHAVQVHHMQPPADARTARNLSCSRLFNTPREIHHEHELIAAQLAEMTTAIKTRGASDERNERGAISKT